MQRKSIMEEDAVRKGALADAKGTTPTPHSQLTDPPADAWGIIIQKIMSTTSVEVSERAAKPRLALLTGGDMSFDYGPSR